MRKKKHKRRSRPAEKKRFRDAIGFGPAKKVLDRRAPWGPVAHGIWVNDPRWW